MYLVKLNEVIYGFRLLKETEVPEISSKGYEFLHEKSGARLRAERRSSDLRPRNL